MSTLQDNPIKLSYCPECRKYMKDVKTPGFIHCEHCGYSNKIKLQGIGEDKYFVASMK